MYEILIYNIEKRWPVFLFCQISSCRTNGYASYRVLSQFTLFRGHAAIFEKIINGKMNSDMEA